MNTLCSDNLISILLVFIILPVLLLFWYCYGTVLVLFWYCSGTVLVLFWYCSGTVQPISCEHMPHELSVL
ncbi:hypothetical protein HYPBUDRAFT_151854 [Hyphopichia burtonii NRRL Y-1933]|uniref:Uncharacterized protein n=1 Tax=Hyphopichia burtonii NRRL Y-1933 TaxID=984485 RepID=A0A1E4RM78_9ASCO|nr:hypothetical protein HYPBUDRAFT_151854 [Hyphopichia burtonii NRRL Y-1933]ODV68346.1 hypothetical protein HYPBUDRAFT_151854 [Hyphopichia burtonii NRRL Y-1933]